MDGCFFFFLIQNIRVSVFFFKKLESHYDCENEFTTLCDDYDDVDDNDDAILNVIISNSD